jgi:DNA-directed RNA polymerase specialized sigma24 family protein
MRDLVTRAQAGDLAYGRLVGATQTMAYAFARSVLRDRAMAENAAQEASLRSPTSMSSTAAAGQSTATRRRFEFALFAAWAA